MAHGLPSRVRPWPPGGRAAAAALIATVLAGCSSPAPPASEVVDAQVVGGPPGADAPVLTITARAPTPRPTGAVGGSGGSSGGAGAPRPAPASPPPVLGRALAASESGVRVTWRTTTATSEGSSTVTDQVSEVDANGHLRLTTRLDALLPATAGTDRGRRTVEVVVIGTRAWIGDPDTSGAYVALESTGDLPRGVTLLDGLSGLPIVWRTPTVRDGGSLAVTVVGARLPADAVARLFARAGRGALADERFGTGSGSVAIGAGRVLSFGVSARTTGSSRTSLVRVQARYEPWRGSINAPSPVSRTLASIAALA